MRHWRARTLEKATETKEGRRGLARAEEKCNGWLLFAREAQQTVLRPARPAQQVLQVGFVGIHPHTL